MTSQSFVFRSTQNIGVAAAEDDHSFLDECFIDTGALEILRDCNDPRRILVGRTGSGKSALLEKLKSFEDHVIRISPEALALTYVANSNTLKFFTESGVDLDIFYRLLWRHIFCVEILKERFEIDDETKKKGFLDLLWSLIPKKKQHERALEYLRKWGESFWLETEYRVKEVTTTFEKDLSGAVEGTLPNIGKLDANASKKLTEEQKKEVIQRAKEVVSKVQIRELSDVIELLGDVLMADNQRRYYITVDKLDEDWVEEALRLRLIRALIETSRDFSRIHSVKIIVVLRSDLLDRVYRFTRASGFQEEKLRDTYLDIRWTSEQLTSLLDARITKLVKHQYTKATVTHKELLPTKVNKQRAIDYMLERTLMRPRDLIQFFNACIKYSDGKPTITLSALREAEGAYSRERYRALADEWVGVYPYLLHTADVLKKRDIPFQVMDIGLEKLENNYLEVLTSNSTSEGVDLNLMKSVFNGTISIEEYRRNTVYIFYKVGLVGLKLEAYSPLSWSYANNATISLSEVSDDTRVFIQPTFWRTLGTNNKQTN